MATGHLSLEIKAASFLQKIKQSTAALHLRLESQALLSAIMQPSVTHLQYYYYLMIMKQVEAAYEKQIVPDFAGSFPGIELRKASQLISEDIENISHGIAQAAVIKNYKIDEDKISVAFALGFMYVMEGSKLGGKVIYKHIHRTLGYTDISGARFITDYGNNTFVLWKAFLSKFSIYVLQNDCEAEAIEGANYAFNSIYEFFELNRSAYEI